MAKKPKTGTRSRRGPSLTSLPPFVDRSDPTELAAKLRDTATGEAPATNDDMRMADEMATARRQFAAALEANGPWSVQAAIDLKWCAGVSGDRSYQWPEVVQQMRDMQQRPFETINRLPSFIKQITNQQRQAGPAMQVVPLKGEASHEAAEVREGLLRHTMLISDGEVQVDTAFEDMAIHGKGFCEVVNRYEDEDNEDTDAQELYVEWRDPFSVYIDPAAVKLDKSDMRYAFIPYDLPTEDYNKLYPESEVAKNGQLSWQGLDLGERARWFPNGCVRVATYYTLEEEQRTTRRGDGSMRTIRVSYVRKRIVNAIEVLEDVPMKRGKYALKRIPIVPILGDRFLIEGKEDYRGMVRLARGPQQMLNFWVTTLTEQIQLSMSAPWLVGWSQIEGLEDIWRSQNTTKLAFLPYKDKNADGTASNTAPPQRIVQEPAIRATTIAIQVANESLQQVMQLYDPSLGKAHPDQSGKALDTQIQQGEIGNSNYIDNLKRFYRSLGRLLLQMYPVYYDTARIHRIVGRDDNPMTVMVHAGEENAPTPDQLEELGEEQTAEQSVFDLTVGQYDVTVSTGPNFLSRRIEANTNMLQMFKIAPTLLPMFLPSFLENSDWPGSHEMAEIAKRTVSAPFQKQNPNDVQQQAAQMKQMLDQAMQQHQLLVQELGAKNDYIKQEQAKYDAQVQIKKAEFDMQVELQKLKNAASIAVAETNAEAKGKIEAGKQQHELIALNMENAHEAAMSEMERGHDVALGHAQATHDAALSGQEHQQELEQIAAQPAPEQPTSPPS